jgi:glutamate-1-semialdehyde aminotransferase
MDEVITGFRIHPGGAQAYFGVLGDMATYGKIIGGGMPIGVIAGSANYMDALDGGHWQYGDTSFPEAGVTYFAGTFVRHPLAMAAAKATLEHLQQQGPELQQQLNRKTTDMVQNLNALFGEYGGLWHIENFGSLFKLQNRSKGIASDLLCYWLRHNGLHIWDGRPCFLTTAHTDGDITEIQAAFRRTLEAMEVAGLLVSSSPDASAPTVDLIHQADKPPVVNARLGTTESGEPAWFVPGIDDTDTYQFYKLA